MIDYETEIPETPAEAAARAEARADDGSWPVPRPDMVAPAPIVERMSLDCLAVFERSNLVDEQSLVRLGWPRETVRRHEDKVRTAFIRAMEARARAAAGRPTKPASRAA